MTWPTVVLSDVAKVVGGSTPKTGTSEFWDGDIAWVTPKELSGLQGTEVVETERTITEAGLKASGAQILPPGAVLLSSRAPIGQTAVVGTPMATNQGFKSLIPDSELLDSRYLLRWLRWKRPEIEGLGTGATFKEVSKRVVERIPIGLPPLEEQRRIAEVLDQADALRAKRREILTRLDELTQSIFADMFGDADHAMPHSPLGEQLDFMTSGSRGWAKYYSASGDLFLRIQNVGRNELKLDDVAYVSAPDTAEARRTRVLPGDVLLTITADLGRTAVVPPGLGRAFINQHLVVLRSSTVNPTYLAAYLASPPGRRQIERKNRAAVKAGLNFEDVRTLTIPVPPLAKQQLFEHRLHAARRFAVSCSKSAARLDELFASLQQRAFRGDLFSSPQAPELADVAA